MISSSAVGIAVACLPFIYYLLVVFSSLRFFRTQSHREKAFPKALFPPVSILKPVRGIDRDAYKNFASFCEQDYPEFEIVFCVGSPEDPIVAVLDQLRADYPRIAVRVLFGTQTPATNDKVAKLARLSSEAQYEHLVISDSDARVRPDYLRNLVEQLAKPTVGAVTCLYVSTGDRTLVDCLQTVGMISDFYPGLLVARELDGVRFALGPTIATTKTRLHQIGGYEKIKNQPADDLLIGRLIADSGYEVELLPYTIETVADYQTLNEFFHKRMRWLVVMRHMRPWGHFGLLFTQALPWLGVAFAVDHSWQRVATLTVIYFALRLATVWIVGIWGLKRPLFKLMPLVIVWDAFAFVLWLASFSKNTVRWRGGEYYIRDGNLFPATTH